jgi:hypothetical protein
VVERRVALALGELGQHDLAPGDKCSFFNEYV